MPSTQTLQVAVTVGLLLLEGGCGHFLDSGHPGGVQGSGSVVAENPVSGITLTWLQMTS